MKLISNLFYILVIVFSNANAFDVNTCKKNENLFFTTIKMQDGEHCIDKDLIRTKFSDMKAISDKIYSNLMGSCNKKIDFFTSPDEVNIKDCQEVIKCTNDLRKVITSGNDRTLICSMDYFEGLSKQQMIYQSLEGFKKERLNKSRDIELKNLKERIKDAVGEEYFAKNFNPKVDACIETKAENKCLKDIPGIDFGMLRSYMKFYAIADIDSRLKQSVDKEDVEFYGRNIQSVTQKIDSKKSVYLSPSGNPDGKMHSAIYRNGDFNKKREGIKLLTHGLLEAGKFSADLFDNDFSNFEEEEKKNKLLSFLKEAYKDNCAKSLDDEVRVCGEFVTYLKETVKEDSPDTPKPELALSKFVKEKEKLLSNKGDLNNKLSLSLDSILNYNNSDAKFDFNQYLNLTQQTYMCNLRYQHRAFGVNEKEFKAYNESLMQQGNTIRGIINNDIGKTLSSSADHIEKQGLGDVGRSITSDLKNLSMDYKETSVAYLSKDSNVRDHLSSGSLSESLNQRDTDSGVNGFGTDSESFFGSNGANLLNKNNYNQSGDKFSVNPNSSKFSDTVSSNTANANTSSAEVNASNASISRKIDELVEREGKLKKKIEDGESTPVESVEVAELRRQIEELKKQMSDQQTKTNSASFSKANPSSEKAPTSRQVSSIETSSNQATFEDRTTQRAQGNTIGQTNNFSSNNNDFQSANERSFSPSSASKSSSAVGSRGNAAVDGRSYGLVLTKSGELTSDLSKIVENPKESEIIGLLEKNDGQPFLIRENGVLIQVQIEKDVAGKVVTINGRPKLKRLKIGTEKEVLVQKELNMIREAKKTTDTVRLRDLNSTTREALK